MPPGRQNAADDELGDDGQDKEAAMDTAAPAPELSAERQSMHLTPLTVEGGGPAMPAASPSELGLPEFPLANAPAAMPEVFQLNQVDVRPVPTFRKMPAYPPAFKQARVEGQSVMRFTVDAEGRTSDITVESATYEAFGKAAAEAIRNWRFKPAEIDGKAVPCAVRINVPFVLY